MRTEQGAYAASLDADSVDAAGQLHEGAFYAWTRAQLSAALGNDAAWAAGVFSVTAAGTFEQGASTLQLLTDPNSERLSDVRARLFAARELRARPGRDDKVVAAWNGWLIDALVQAGMVFDRPDWVVNAETAAETVWSVHWRDGRLRRASRGGTAGPAPGILEDYAAVAQAYVRLATATTEPRWIERARLLLGVITEQFGDGRGGFFDTAADAEELYSRPQDPTDNATPSGLSASIHALALMAELTGEPAYAERAERAAQQAGALPQKVPRFAGWLLADAISRTPAHTPVQVAVVAEAGGGTELVRAAWRHAPAGSVTPWSRRARPHPALPRWIGW